MEQRMNKAIDSLIADFNAIRAGRANPAVLDKVMVDYYGTQTPLTQLANVSVPEPRTLVVQPYDAGILKEAERAVIAAELGLSPNNDGKMLRINFPQPTEETRQRLVKDLHKRAEEAKISIRGIRRDGMDGYKTQFKNKEITEDDLAGLEKELQNLTDKKIKEVEGIAAKKEKELLEV